MLSRMSTADEVTAFVNNHGYPGPVRAGLAGLTGSELWALTPVDLKQSGLSRLRAISLYRILHAHDDPPSEYMCPITHDVMKEAMFLVGDGHSYDKWALANLSKLLTKPTPIQPFGLKNYEGGVTNSTRQLLGASLKIGNYAGSAHFACSATDSGFDAIVGVPWLRKNNATLNLGAAAKDRMIIRPPGMPVVRISAVHKLVTLPDVRRRRRAHGRRAAPHRGRAHWAHGACGTDYDRAQPWRGRVRVRTLL